MPGIDLRARDRIESLPGGGQRGRRLDHAYDSVGFDFDSHPERTCSPSGSISHQPSARACPNESAEHIEPLLALQLRWSDADFVVVLETEDRRYAGGRPGPQVRALRIRPAARCCLRRGYGQQRSSIEASGNDRADRDRGNTSRHQRQIGWHVAMLPGYPAELPCGFPRGLRSRLAWTGRGGASPSECASPQGHRPHHGSGSVTNGRPSAPSPWFGVAECRYESGGRLFGCGSDPPQPMPARTASTGVSAVSSCRHAVMRGASRGRACAPPVSRRG